MAAWLRNILSKDERLSTVEYPSAQYATQVDAIVALLDAGFTENEWASFDARDAGGDEWVTVQVWGHRINTLAEPVDLAAALRAAGLEALATLAHKASVREQNRAQYHDPEFMQKVTPGTLFSLNDATNAELAEAVHAIFQHHYGFSNMYELEGARED